MNKQERIARIAKIQASRAYGKTNGEKVLMGHVDTSIDRNGFEWAAEVSYRNGQSFRDNDDWRVDIYVNGDYICHALFETIEEAELYASDMLSHR